MYNYPFYSSNECERSFTDQTSALYNKLPVAYKCLTDLEFKK